MPFEKDPARREFLKSFGAVGIAAGAAEREAPDTKAVSQSGTASAEGQQQQSEIRYPRSFSGGALKTIAFPLGGIGAGSISLGGRGQLRDWEIFNRPHKGNAPEYAFASIWLQPRGGKPMAHVLEARVEQPYTGQDGLGSQNAPGLSRLQGATFSGEFPRAHIEFQDDRLPVKITLEAGTPFIPLDADASGLPVAVLRYRISNPSHAPVTASIAFSIENPVKPATTARDKEQADTRVNEPRVKESLRGLLMHNPALPAKDVENGTFALAVLNAPRELRSTTDSPDHLGSRTTPPTGFALGPKSAEGPLLPHGAGSPPVLAADGSFTSLRGWTAGRWWDSPLSFWDDFSSDGELGPEPAKPGPVGAVCLKREIAPGEEAEYAFLLAWHFPNRTPERCGWTAPKGQEDTLIGNWYSTRFSDAWAAAEYAAAHLATLEGRTERFLRAMRETTLPGAVKDAALSNLSTLVTTTCFRTADGEFHAFEGSDDHIGCCFGNCTHVWNYETATAHLFPSLSRSLRRAAFGYSMDDRGGMYFRQLLPDGFERFGYIAADGQMGQIMKAYIDWQFSGDRALLEEFWPRVKQAISFAWIPGGWDANRDGVMEGVQHNTYDVEFYGPNPLCGVYYLGALRAAEEMARAMHDEQSAAEYRRLFERGKAWTDANLFNGSYYEQRIEGHPPDAIAQGLRSGMGADDPEKPQYQVGAGCLVDQLLGQYLADVAGLGPLLEPKNIERTIDSIYRNNHKANLLDHDCVQRTYALNDEAALVVCQYPASVRRPKIPFPYYAEVWTGLEYSTAALMLFHGMTEQGLACIADARRRYDGERRNPWDEPECGHHYARAMSSWSGFLATSGFHYRGQIRRIEAVPRIQVADFRSFWAGGAGWGTFAISASQFEISPAEGSILIREFELPGDRSSNAARVDIDGTVVPHRATRQNDRTVIALAKEVRLEAGQRLTIKS